MDNKWDVSIRPSKLYKYYSPTRSQFLVDRMVCFSTLAQLNDPFEGISPVVSLFPRTGPDSMRDRVGKLDLKREAFKRIFSMAQVKGFTPEQSKILARQASGNEALMSWASEELVKITERLLESVPISYLDFEREIAAVVGVFCLSEDPTSAPMWAHYGAKYTGFLVEFDTSDLFFNLTGIQGLRPITYEQRSLDSMKALDESDLLLRKSVDWAYEKEWRTFRLLEKSDAKVDGGYHLYIVPQSAISAIVLGENCTDELASRAVTATSKYNWTLKGVRTNRGNKTLEMVTLKA